jgi:hypothetical protein
MIRKFTVETTNAGIWSWVRLAKFCSPLAPLEDIRLAERDDCFKRTHYRGLACTVLARFLQVVVEVLDCQPPGLAAGIPTNAQAEVSQAEIGLEHCDEKNE